MRWITDDRPPYWKPGPHRSELRADAAPLVPGEAAEITLGLWATSVLVRKGHRIRVAIAGADADTFLATRGMEAFRRSQCSGAQPIRRGSSFPRARGRRAGARIAE